LRGKIPRRFRPFFGGAALFVPEWKIIPPFRPVISGGAQKVKFGIDLGRPARYNKK
jgi:hypothetical protein